MPQRNLEGSSPQRRYYFQILLLILALSLILWGILRKEPDETWNKAHFICLECIGIG